MKKSYFIVILIMLLNSCLDRAVDRRKIKIINCTDKTIYCLISQNDSIRSPYIEYSESTIDNYYKINGNSTAFLKDSPRSWDGYIKNSVNGKMKLFIISKDSIDEHGLKGVLIKNIYTEVLELDIEDLNNNNWQIIYAGK
jgi:hypothetical protein